MKTLELKFCICERSLLLKVTEIPDQTGRPRTDKRGGEEISY